jgi:GT2 family glycosyltransferase
LTDTTHRIHTVSASVVSHNNAVQVLELFRSLARHIDPAHLEVYLIDNASSDHTVTLVRGEFPWVHIIQSNRNEGFGAAHNCVLPLITSKYHAVINPDIVFVEDVLTPLVAYLESNPRATVITPLILNPDGSEQHLPQLRPHLNYLIARRFEHHSKWARRACALYTRADEDRSQPMDIEMATGSFFVIRTAVFKELGGFDPGFFLYFEDSDLSCRVIANGGHIVFYPAAQVVHHYARAAMTSTKAFAIQIKSMFRFFNKHGW